MNQESLWQNSENRPDERALSRGHITAQSVAATGQSESSTSKERPAEDFTRSAINASGEQAHARRSDPRQSHEAAKSVCNLGRTKDRILSILRSQGPMTDDEIRHYFERFVDFKVSPSGLRTRRDWLVQKGLVYEAGEGKSDCGRNCAKWAAISL